MWQTLVRFVESQAALFCQPASAHSVVIVADAEANCTRGTWALVPMFGIVEVDSEPSTLNTLVAGLVFITPVAECQAALETAIEMHPEVPQVFQLVELTPAILLSLVTAPLGLIQ